MEYIKYEELRKLTSKDFEENSIIGYDIGNGDTTDYPITANCWDKEDNLWWFGSNNYDYVYSLDELKNKDIVKLL